MTEDIEKENQQQTPASSGASVVDGSISPETNELVFSKDGFKLFPQPVAGDDLDPLNWSFAQKHIILAIVMSM